MKRVIEPNNQNNPEPYLSWVITVRNAEKTLEATLKSIRERTPRAEIVIVDTCSSDSTVEISKKYADVWVEYKGPKGTWDTLIPAVDDMAAARQFSFEQAHGRWRVWADADDRIVGGAEAQRYLEINGRWRPKQKGRKVADDPEASSATASGLDSIRGEDGHLDLEDFLRWLEKNRPDVTMIWCPYLYQRDEKDNALSWLERERFVRWDSPPKFRWAEPAHEILVPIGSYRPIRIDLPHLLWVHEKKWTGEEFNYSYKRHSAIMLKQYEEGDITFRRCRYLSGFAQVFWPHRQLEFLNKAHEVAFTALDRYRALIALGCYYAGRGLYVDAQERFGAAFEIRSDLPDAFYAAAQVAYESEDFTKAVLWLRRGVALELGNESEVNPRDHAVKYPTLLSMALQRIAEDNAKVPAPEIQSIALGLFQEAAEIAGTVRNKMEVGGDAIEAQSYFLRARNKWLGQKALMALKEVKDFLLNNDEPQKALALLDAFPHTADNHPVKMEMEAFAKKLRKHISDPQAYSDFYNSALETGYMTMPPANYLYENSHYRVRWIVDYIKQAVGTHTPITAPITVADIGSCDGIVGIPLLLTCPEGIQYSAYDVNKAGLDAFKGLLDHHNIKWRGSESIKLIQERYPAHTERFDVVIVGEIIEHVPDPVAWLKEIKAHLKTNGVLLCTTPWGGFDEGHPPPMTGLGTPRDERGHLRAYSPWAAYKDVKDTGYQVQELAHIGSPTNLGHAMVIRAGVSALTSPGVAVYVPGALWKWNGSVVDRDGIGASEEMIVRLGEYLSKERPYEVYGPVPEQEVYRGVGYFHNEAIRTLNELNPTKIVISRSPSSFIRVNDLITKGGGDPARHPKVLWLQDTVYSDLNAEVADQYESIVTVSNWHKELTVVGHGLRPDQTDKVKVAYNFLQREHFEEAALKGWRSGVGGVAGAGAEVNVKQPYHFIWASSPDRGLIKLLQLWPRILEKYPEATLSIFYGWKGAARLGAGHDAAWNQRYLTMRRQYEPLRHQKGVAEVGLVNHLRLASEYMKASVWGYSTTFAETGCLSAAKARAAGAVPVTSAYAALNETAACPQATLIPLDHGKPNPTTGEPAYGDGYDDLFLEGVRKAIETSTVERQEMAMKAIEDFSFEAVKPVWDDIWTV